VAVVDDQRDIRDGFTRTLSSVAGISVIAVGETGEDAIRIAAHHAPDVIIMDIRMPRLDGISATRAILEHEESTARILVVTTFNLDQYVYRALQAGASGFLLKDATPQQLVDAVRTVASGAAIVDPVVTRALIGRHADRIRPPTAPATELAALTSRERDVLNLLARGSSNAEIAAELVITRETVKTYVSRILAKLHLRDRVQAVVLAHRAGLVDD
jgi:DNA-binding NarL/FixJ family response regulator